jgi:hypothetical protein
VSTNFAIPGVPILSSTAMPQDKMRVLIHGFPGSGKTYYASTIAALGKTLFVDMVSEKGGRSFRGAAWDKNIDVVRPTSVVELTNIYKALSKGEHPYQAVVLDSLSAVQKSSERWLLGYEEDAVSEIKKGRSGPDMRTWGSILNIMTDICTFWMALADGNRKNPIHVVFTSQTKGHEDDEGNTRLYPDVSKGSRSAALATPDYVLFADFEEVPADDGSGLKMKHVIRIGPDMDIVTKARIPANLHGKIPDVLGLGERPLSLADLAKTLGIQ